MCTVQGAVYLMGTTMADSPARISRSTDNGRTWTGVQLFNGSTFGTGPMPVVFADGYAFRALEVSVSVVIHTPHRTQKSRQCFVLEGHARGHGTISPTSLFIFCFVSLRQLNHNEGALVWADASKGNLLEAEWKMTKNALPFDPAWWPYGRCEKAKLPAMTYTHMYIGCTAISCFSLITLPLFPPSQRSHY